MRVNAENPAPTVATDALTGRPSPSARRDRFVHRSAIRLTIKAGVVIAAPAILRPLVPELLRDWFVGAGAEDPVAVTGQVWALIVWVTTLAGVAMLFYAAARLCCRAMGSTDQIRWSVAVLQDQVDELTRQQHTRTEDSRVEVSSA